MCSMLTQKKSTLDAANTYMYSIVQLNYSFTNAYTHFNYASRDYLITSVLSVKLTVSKDLHRHAGGNKKTGLLLISIHFTLYGIT